MEEIGKLINMNFNLYIYLGIFLVLILIIIYIIKAIIGFKKDKMIKDIYDKINEIYENIDKSNK